MDGMEYFFYKGRALNFRLLLVEKKPSVCQVVEEVILLLWLSDNITYYAYGVEV